MCVLKHSRKASLEVNYMIVEENTAWDKGDFIPSE